jgi:hypothetical protein
VYQQRVFLFAMDMTQVSRHCYWSNPFPESLVIAQYLRENTRPGDRILVVGSEPQIYFYAHRRSVTGYIYTYALMEPQPYAPRMQKEMIAEIERADPEYVVYVGVLSSWLVRESSSVYILNWFDDYKFRHLDRVGVVDILDRKTVYKWGAAAKDYRPRSEAFVEVYRRKTRPAPATQGRSDPLPIPAGGG